MIHRCAVRDASHATSRVVADEGGQGRAQGPGKPEWLQYFMYGYGVKMYQHVLDLYIYILDYNIYIDTRRL